LEPHRGFHTFMRALPRLLALSPRAQVDIVGAEAGGYGAGAPDGRSWRARLSEEVGGLDPSRVHFLGTLEPRRFHETIGRASAHTYLTYPF
ncbi:hypothetical protein, partial [Klebsiella aerogenes]